MALKHLEMKSLNKVKVSDIFFRKALLIFALLFAATIILLFSCSSEKKSFSEFQKEISAFSASEQNSRLDAYFEKQNSFPIIADSVACFILKDTSRKQVYLSGDMCSWKPDSMRMERIGLSSYYFKEFVCPEDARLEYKFVTDSTFILDPRNPFYAEGGMGKNSLLLMPEYKYAAVTLARRNRALSPIDTMEFRSRILKNNRTVYYYRHPKAAASSPLIIFNDGADYLKSGNAAIVMDNLIEEKKIPAVNALFVNPVERMKEYRLDDSYLRMIFRELIPYIKNKYKLSADLPISMGGVSLGGLISVYALKEYGHTLSFIFSQSGAFWIDDREILNVMAGLAKISTKIFLDFGTFENTEEDHNKLAEILQSKDANYIMHSYPEGHNWGNWRTHLDRALIFGLRGN